MAHDVGVGGNTNPSASNVASDASR